MTIGPENPYRVEVDHTAEMRCYVDSKPRSKSHNFDGDSHENGSDSIYNDDSPDIYGVSDLMMGVQDGQCQMGILGEIHRYQLPPCHSTGITVFPPHLEIPKKIFHKIRLYC